MQLRVDASAATKSRGRGCRDFAGRVSHQRALLVGYGREASGAEEHCMVVPGRVDLWVRR